MVDRAEDHQDRRHTHHHVKVGDDEHGVRKRNIHDGIAEEQAGDPPVDERDNEPEGEQHRNREVDVTAPQGQDPVVDLDRSGDGDDQRGGGEKEPEIGVHATDVHVVRPYHEAEAADYHNRPNHHAVAEDVSSRMDADQVGDDTEGRQGDDIDLRMTEKPEQVLKQDRAAFTVREPFPELD